MLCEQCGKRPASVHITKVENGKKTDIHLCENCASYNTISMNTNFTFGDILAGLINSNSVPLKIDVVQDTKCNICGLSYTKFKETGRFGCSNCYTVFGERLNPLFKRVHGNINHTGKIPERAGSRIKSIRLLDKLKNELSEAIKHEEYEKAADLRDQIRALSNRGEEEKQNELD